MDVDLIQALLDQSGVLTLSVLILWRVGRQLDRLIERIDKLADAVRESPRS